MGFYEGGQLEMMLQVYSFLSFGERNLSIFTMSAHELVEAIKEREGGSSTVPIHVLAHWSLEAGLLNDEVSATCLHIRGLVVSAV